MLFSHLRDDKIRPLASATTSRLPELPDVPTMIESGFPDFVASSWTGVVAPAGTPKDVIARLNAAINTGLGTTAIRERFKQLAAQAQPGTPEDLADFIEREAPEVAGHGQARRNQRRVTITS